MGVGVYVYGGMHFIYPSVFGDCGGFSFERFVSLLVLQSFFVGFCMCREGRTGEGGRRDVVALLCLSVVRENETAVFFLFYFISLLLLR